MSFRGSSMGSFRASDYKAPGGKLIRVRFTEENEMVRSVRISGDFFLIPEDSLSQLENMLRGVALREETLRHQVDRFFEIYQVKTLGVTLDDLVKAFLSAKEEVLTA